MRATSGPTWRLSYSWRRVRSSVAFVMDAWWQCNCGVGPNVHKLGALVPPGVPDSPSHGIARAASGASFGDFRQFSDDLYIYGKTYKYSV
jgi:hypothetical protein